MIIIIIIIKKCGIYWQIVIGALGAIPGGLSEYLENDCGWYVGEDVSEDCSIGISNHLEKVHGTVKISTALDSLRPLVFGWDPKLKAITRAMESCINSNNNNNNININISNDGSS